MADKSRDTARYLREKAATLRDAARRYAPELSSTLLSLAEEFEAQATRLEGDSDGTAH